jgi:hypothetical protein
MFDLRVDISQAGTVRKQLTLSPLSQIVYDNVTGIRASMLTLNYDTLAVPLLVSYFYLLGPSTAPFLVPQSAFCPDPSATNCLGMTNQAFLAATACSSGLGQYTQVPGSSLTDQFSQYYLGSLGTFVQPSCSSLSSLASQSPPTEVQ